ncbi:MAG: hypothetical protein ACIAQZ_14435 [Sedimentisphaeraceae bacterium JB056]
MQLTLNRSSVVNVLADLQSAVDNGLNNGRFMLCNHRLRYRVDQRKKIVEFEVIRPMMREYRIKGEISKASHNSYNVATFISPVELISTIMFGIFMVTIWISLILSSGNFFNILMLTGLVAILTFNYKHTNGKIKKIFKHLKLNTADKISSMDEGQKFERFIETDSVKWVYVKNGELIKRTQISVGIDLIAIVCIIVGFVCFFNLAPMLADIINHGTPERNECIKLFKLAGVFLLCVFITALSLFSQRKRR